MKRLLASDLDGTLVGDDDALRLLNEALLAERDRWIIAYVTGRNLDSTLRLMQHTPLLTPDLLVTGVGTEIHWRPPWRPDPAWRHHARGWSPRKVRSVARRFPPLTPQPTACQGPFKCSYHLSPEHTATLAHLEPALRRAGVRARLVYSSERDLDILPAHAGKGNAVRYVARTLGLPVSAVVACGDSGNDRDMLELGGPAVVVANAHRELAPPGAYRARSPHAGGVHEALHQLGLLTTGFPEA